LAEVEQARLQKPRAEKVFNYFIADDHQIAIDALTRIAKYGAPIGPDSIPNCGNGNSLDRW